MSTAAKTASQKSGTNTLSRVKSATIKSGQTSPRSAQKSQMSTAQRLDKFIQK